MPYGHDKSGHSKILGILPDYGEMGCHMVMVNPAILRYWGYYRIMEQWAAIWLRPIRPLLDIGDITGLWSNGLICGYGKSGHCKILGTLPDYGAMGSYMVMVDPAILIYLGSYRIMEQWADMWLR